MYKIFFDELNIKYEKGLSQKEIIKIEKKYNIIFPPEMRKFLADILPIDNGFYNWRDFSLKNINLINNAIKAPILGIIKEINYINWNNKWGKEPQNVNAKQKVLKKLLANAPKLIPIYGHRYAVSSKDSEFPIFSICGADIIYYGKNFGEYLNNEFCKKVIEKDKIFEYKYTPFWSDLL